MSLSRANGERSDVARDEYEPWVDIEKVYSKAFPTRHKWFNVLFLRRKLKLSWRKIGRCVGYSHVHCKRLFVKAAVDVEALQEKILQGVTFPRIAPIEDEDE